MIDFSTLEKVAEFKNYELNWLEGRDVNAVYLILVDDEYYIGSSHYVYLRIQQHLKLLLTNNHHSDKLQEKFNSIHDFSVYILERGIEKKNLLIREEFYIRKYNPSLNIMKPKGGYKHRIKELIKEKGYTQQQFADKIGMSRVGLAQIVNGKPSYPTLEKIAEALEVPMWQLFASPEEVRKESGASVCPYCGGLLDVEVNLKKKG